MGVYAGLSGFGMPKRRNRAHNWSGERTFRPILFPICSYLPGLSACNMFARALDFIFILILIMTHGLGVYAGTIYIGFTRIYLAIVQLGLRNGTNTSEMAFF
jgi:hypothetical protein